MTDQPLTPVQEHCQRDWGHIQYGTLTGPTGECVPNCPQCTIDRLRADLATARDALKRIENETAAPRIAAEALDRIGEQ